MIADSSVGSAIGQAVRIRRAVFAVLVACAAFRVWVWYAAVNTPAPCITGRHLLTGRVEAVQLRNDDSALLAVRLDTGAKCAALRGARLRLSWYPPVPQLVKNQHLQVEARLKPPWGTKNPGGFNYRRWLMGQGYVATGYVITLHRLDETPETDTLPADLVYGGLLNALISGDRSGVDGNAWQLLRDTGTVHLLVISGLHVGVCGGLVYLLVFAAAKLSGLRWCQPRTAALFGTVTAVLALVVYSGADPPVVRAGAMVTIAAVCVILRRRLAWWHCLFLTAVGAVCIHPQIVLRHGFWLSYAAVAALLWIFGQTTRRFSSVRTLLTTQIALAVMLAPWLGLTVATQPLVSPVANLLVVPLVSLLVVPAAFIGGFLYSAVEWQWPADFALRLADVVLALVWAVLDRLSGLLPVIGYQDPQRLVLAIAGSVLCMLPLARYQRLLAAFACLPLLLPNVSQVPAGEFRVTVLDVGQGSAAIVDTRRHRLLIDAGASYPSGFSMGEAVVLPALVATGPARADGLLLSHLDIDHAGGAAALRRRYPDLDETRCIDAGEWHWDGVRFVMLQADVLASENDRSCTLLVQSQNGAAYFSGDIERSAERLLRSRLPAGVDLLIAPHHGSRTSSSPAFVRHLQPRHVVFSAGRDNRYGHPHADVVKRYAALGSSQWITGVDGALVWHSRRPEVVTTSR